MKTYYEEEQSEIWNQFMISAKHYFNFCKGMTNCGLALAAYEADGRTMTIEFKSGEQTVGKMRMRKFEEIVRFLGSDQILATFHAEAGEVLFVIMKEAVLSDDVVPLEQMEKTLEAYVGTLNV